MTVKELLESIQKLPISNLENKVLLGHAIDSYPYGPDITTTPAHSISADSKSFIIYTI